MGETKNVIIHGDSRAYIPRIHTPIDCVITDPPFGMNFESNRAVTPEGKARNIKIEGDATPQKAIATFKDIMRVIIPKLAPMAEIYVFTAWHVLEWWIPAVKSLSPNIELKQMLIWDKGYPGQGDLVGNWGCGHEIILYLKKGRRPVRFRRSGIIHVDKIPAGQNIHPTEKPVALIEHLIGMSTDPGDLIVDPYSGSGSTSVAAQRLGRNSLAFDIHEPYVIESKKRLEQVGFNLEV